jgi:hypothetical protein
MSREAGIVNFNDGLFVGSIGRLLVEGWRIGGDMKDREV